MVFLSRKIMDARGTRPRLKKALLQSRSMETQCMQGHGAKVCFGRKMPAEPGRLSGMDYALMLVVATHDPTKSLSCATRLST